MSLFFSPRVGPLNSENAKTLMQGKLDDSNTLTVRKPFMDRTVNCKTPEKFKVQQGKATITGPKEKSPVPSSNETLDIEDYFTYKETPDNYEDVYLAYGECLNKQHVFNIVKSYLDNSTPPPSPTSVNHSFELHLQDDSFEAPLRTTKLIKDNHFNNELLMESFDSIDLPMIEDDDDDDV